MAHHLKNIIVKATNLRSITPISQTGIDLVIIIRDDIILHSYIHSRQAQSNYTSKTKIIAAADQRACACAKWRTNLRLGG
jgi:hypothetical protein